MSLIDADKTSDNRGKPTPNSDDGVSFRMAHKTNQTTYRESGTSVTARQVFVQAGTMWIGDDGKVNSVYMYIPELTTIPVQIIAEPGFDVFDDVLNGEVERPKV